MGSSSNSELSTAQQRTLRVLYDRFVRLSKWPTFEDIDHFLDRGGVDHPLVVLRSLQPRYVGGLSEAGVPAMTDEIRLSLWGLTAVSLDDPAAMEDLELFARSVEAAVVTADRTDPPAVAVFEALEFLGRLFPAGPEMAVVLRLHGLWHSAGVPLWKNLRGGGTIQWSAELDRQSLRNYRGVVDGPTLVSAERQRRARDATERLSRKPAPQGAATPASSQQPTGTSPANSSWLALLPENFQAIIAPRMQSGAKSDSINAAWIELADLIHHKTGLELDNTALVNQAFGEKSAGVNHLAPAPLSGETRDNFHVAYFDFMRGLARIRNVHAHRGRPTDLSELHFVSMLMLIAECYEQVSSLPDPG